MSLGVTLLSVDEMRELGRITDEEDGSVVEHPIEVTLLSPDLDSETTRVTSGISRSGLTTDSGEADSCTGLGANFFEEAGTGEVTDVVGNLEVTVGTSTLGVDDTLWDTLSVEVSEEVNVVEV